MSGYLSMVEASLPPGFRFHPRDDELICDYLAPSKFDHENNTCLLLPTMIDIDLNKCEPWDLPDMACVGSKEWYFFNLRDRKYATGQRTNRATMSGYWKATGKDRQVVRKGTSVGMRKTLVFYQGRAPKGKKTDWVMHEFRSESRNDPSPRLVSCKEDWVLCKVLYKSRGIGGSSKQKAKESCYEDTGSSSLPPLTETYNFPPINLLPPPPMNVSLVEQVPCFSNYQPLMMNHTMEKNASFSKGHLPSTCFKSVLDQLCKNMDEVASSESYLTENAAGITSPIWFPNFQSFA